MRHRDGGGGGGGSLTAVWQWRSLALAATLWQDQQARDRDNTTISPLRSGWGEAGGVGVSGQTGGRSGRQPAVTPEWSRAKEEARHGK